MGPNVSIYSGTHPLDPALRNGTKGPESGKEVHIGEDCWICGDVTIVPGVKLGRGVTIGAGSVVTKVSVYSAIVIRYFKRIWPFFFFFLSISLSIFESSN